MSTDGTQNGIDYRDFFSRLMAPIDPRFIYKRKQAGRDLDYITARVCMNRLDEVAGPAGWKDEYFETKEGLKCRLSIRMPTGEWVAKEDGGAAAGMSEADNDEKSAYSDAFKRAAVKWGVGRQLYKDGMPDFAAPGFSSPVARRDDPAPRREPSRQPEPERHQPADRQPQGERRQYDGPDRPPTNGRALFAWTKKAEEQHDIQLLKYLNDWSKAQGFPGRMVDWDSDQVAKAVAESARKFPDCFSQPALPPVRETVGAGVGAGSDDEPEDIPF